MIIEKLSTGQRFEVDRATYEKLINRGTQYKIISEDDALTQAAREFKGKIPVEIETKIKEAKKKTKSNGTRSKKTTNKSL